MTTEQAAEKLGMVAVVWPRATEARRAEIMAGLSAEQQEAVRVLFGEGEAPEVREPDPAAPDTSTDDLIAALQNFTRSIQREKPAAAVVEHSPEPQPPAARQSTSLAGALRQLAEQIEQRQAAPAPEVVATPAPKRQRVDYSAKLHAARATRQAPATPSTPPKPKPRLKVVQPSPPARAPAPAQQLYMGGTAEDWARVRRAGIIATIQAIAFILAIPAAIALFIWMGCQK